MMDPRQILDWLGSKGAIAGLEASELTVSQLYEIAKNHDLVVDKRMKRSEIIDEIIHSKIPRIEKKREKLLKMGWEDLLEHFRKRRVSGTELLNILAEFDVYPGSEEMKRLREFTAREISEIGVFQRVSKGKHGA